MRQMNWLATGVLGLAAMLAGCGEQSSTTTTTTGTTTSGGGGGGNPPATQTVTVGTEPTFPPFESINAAGEFEGFDVDLVKAIGEKAGFTVKFQNLGFDALIPALQSGQIGMIAAGMSITDERKQSVDFSDPYIEAGLVLAVRQNEANIKGVADLKGKTVAVQRGSTGAESADKLKAEGGVASVKHFATVPLAMMELAQGGVDAVINDKPTSEVYVAKQPGQIKLLPEVLASDSYGFALRKGNTELLTKVNDGLKALQADGTLDKLKQKHFAASLEATKEETTATPEGGETPAAPAAPAAPAPGPAQP